LPIDQNEIFIFETLKGQLMMNKYMNEG